MFLLYLVVDKAISDILYPWMPMMPSLITSRMILNMQAASYDPTKAAPEFTTEIGQSYTCPGLELSLLPQAGIDSRSRDCQQPPP
ncbi:hypothetical protein BS17DRAFT_780727 [Gyrodon lividus]|nr:hypothetical protein BS17DRAFT_780727 [Gyrodon lividus]